MKKLIVVLLIISLVSNIVIAQKIERDLSGPELETAPEPETREDEIKKVISKDDIEDILDKKFREEPIREVTKIVKQPPTITVMGTEYIPNQSGKVFLQVTDEGEDIENATCFVTIWYPNSTAKFADDQLMLIADAGLHFYDFIVPSIPGVYMVTAECHYFQTLQYYYEPGSISGPAITDVVSNFSIGNPVYLNDWKDKLYLRTQSVQNGTFQRVIQDYTFTSNLTNLSDVIVAWTGQADELSAMTISWYNWSDGSYNTGSFTLLQPLADPVTHQVSASDEVRSFGMPLDGIAPNSSIRIRIDAFALTSFNLYQNLLNIFSTVLVSQTQHNIKGGSELHVTTELLEFINKEEEMATETVTMLLVITMFGIGLLLTFAGKNMLAYVTGTFSFLAAWFLLQSPTLGLSNISLIPFLLAMVSILKAIRLKTSDKSVSESIYIE